MSPTLVLDVVSNGNTGLAQLASASTAAVNSTSTAGIIPEIQNFANSVAANASLVTVTLDNAILDMAKAAVVLLIISGVLLWFSRIGRRLGK